MTCETHKSYDSKFKLKVALAAIKNDRPIEDLIKEFNVATCQVYAWKKQLEEQGDMIFADKRKTEKHDSDNEKKLHTIIKKVTDERDFLARVLNR